MISVPSWQNYSPLDQAAEGDRTRESQSSMMSTLLSVNDSKMRQQAMEQSIRQAAQRYQAQQQYRDYVQQGGDPDTGMRMYGPLMFGASAAGMYQFFKPPTSVVGPGGQPEGSYPGQVKVLPQPRGAGAPGPSGMAPGPQQTISIPGAAPRAYAPTTQSNDAVPLHDGQGNVIGYNYGHSTHWNGATPEAKVSDIDKIQLSDIQRQINDFNAQVVKGEMTDAQAVRARIQVEQLQKQKNDLISKYKATAPASTGPAQPDVTYPPPPSVGMTATSAAPDTSTPPAPKDPSTRKVGQLYKTPKGVYKWTKDGWMAVQ